MGLRICAHFLFSCHYHVENDRLDFWIVVIIAAIFRDDVSANKQRMTILHCSSVQVPLKWFKIIVRIE